MGRAFLIGAGSTKQQYGNAPICIDFFEKLSIKNPVLFNSIKQATKDFVSNLKGTDIEFVMGRSNKFTIPKKTKFDVLVHQAIYELLAKETRSLESDIKSAISSGNENELTQLQVLVLDKRMDYEKDFFMTLNYDLYLDREVIVANKGNIDYGIKESYLYEDYEFRSPNEKFSVYHLHGALNWIQQGEKIQVKLGAVKPVSHVDGSNLCLIPPGEDKEFPKAINNIWYTAEQRLFNETSEMIIIGCGLNHNDEKLCDFVRNYSDAKGGENIKVIYKPENMNDVYHIEPKYTEIVGKKCKFFRNGFNDNAIDFIFK